MNFDLPYLLENLMFGSLLVCFQNYMVSKLGAEGWTHVLSKAGLPSDKVYNSMRFYPDEELQQLLEAAVFRLGIPKDKLEKELGNDFAKYLITNFGSMFLSNWKTLDILEKAAPPVYKALQISDPNPPKFYIKFKRISPDEGILYYMNPRKLCPYVIGIIEGVAENRNEIIQVNQTSCMQHGAAECEIHLKVIKHPNPKSAEPAKNT